MRIVTKINLTLIGVVAVSAIFNFVALNLTVMPSFLDLEGQSADQNQARALEAIELQKTQVSNSAGDYAFWDDTYEFLNGSLPDFVENNVSAESLRTLGIDYFVLIDRQGRVVLDRGFDFSANEPELIDLIEAEVLPDEDVFRQAMQVEDPQRGLIRSAQGMVALGYAPVLRSDRSGPPAGTLVFGRLLDIEALRSATKVDLRIAPPGEQSIADGPNADHLVRTDELRDVRGNAIGFLESFTPRNVSAIGYSAIGAAMGYLVLAGALLIGVLGFVLNRVAVRRIQKVRNHLVAVAETGELRHIDEDGAEDELSDTLRSFNHMASQLAELRESLRRRDFQHGASEQAAALLHNLRNALSPVTIIAWGLAKPAPGSKRQNLLKALEQLSQPGISPDRAAKLNEFVALSVAQLLRDEDTRGADLSSMAEMLRHVDELLKDYDLTSKMNRPSEIVDLSASAHRASQLVTKRVEVRFENDGDLSAEVFAPKTTIDQILANLLVNAAEAIEASAVKAGQIEIGFRAAELQDQQAIEVFVRDNGEGIEPTALKTVFERGYSTRKTRSGGLGLHWCANAANAMGGRIYAESDGKGKGATLHLVLPCRTESQIGNAA